MSHLAALLISYCHDNLDYTPEQLEQQRIWEEERKEKRKHTIFNKTQFEQFAKAEGENGALGVKVLRDKTGVLHWMETKVWPFHYTYLVRNLGETRTLQEFNEQMYTGKDRSMMLATVMAYTDSKDQRYCCLELNPADPMDDLEKLNGFFEDVKKNFMTEDPSNVTLYFHPTSAVQIEAIKNKQICLPVITSETLFGGIMYQMIYPGKLDYKTVRVFYQKSYKEEDLHNWLLKRTPDEIVVIPSVPADIPVVGAVICGEIIPPLCHVALLCQNRQTPCCYFKDCMAQASKGLANRVVTGTIAKTGLCLSGTYEIEEQHTAPPPKLEVHQPNMNVTNLVDVHEDKELAEDSNVVGAKAAQFAKVESVYNQSIFNGTFVVPFSHYHKHVYLTHQVSTAICYAYELTKGKDFSINKFKAVQEAIRQAPIDHELVVNVIERIKKHNMTSVIFRSSTNAEDLPGFNGAGLYESVPLSGSDLHDAQKVGSAIKKVWASVWKPTCVKERQHYGIPHESVKAAVLVQPFIDKDMKGVKVHYNGVCITHDVARHKVKHGFVVNCFPGTKLRATNIYKDQFPEHTTIVLGRETSSIDLQISTLATGQSQSMITQEDAEKMVRVFGAIHHAMLNKPHQFEDTMALDIEFMIVDNDNSNNSRELVVLQARPYTVNVAAPDVLGELDRDVRLSVAGYQWSTENDKRMFFYTGFFCTTTKNFV